jgi:hypothetical protein
VDESESGSYVIVSFDVTGFCCSWTDGMMVLCIDEWINGWLNVVGKRTYI